METGQGKCTYSDNTEVFCGVLRREETAESVVPDVLPDVGAILAAEGQVYLRGKEAGPGYVKINAVMQASVIYSPEDGGAPRAIQVEIPVELTSDAAGVDESVQLTAALRLERLDARALNSRKVLVRCEVSGLCQCWALCERCFGAEVADAGGTLRLQKSTTALSTVSSVREKTFVITDDYNLPTALGEGWEILSTVPELSVGEVQAVGTKLVFKGRMDVAVNYRAGGGDAILRADYSTQFSQMMDMAAPVEADNCWVSLMGTGVYFDRRDLSADSGALGAELHLVAQAVSFAAAEAEYVSDAYSNACAVSMDFETAAIVAERRVAVLSASGKWLLEPPAPALEVLSSSARVGRVARTEEGLDVEILAGVLYRSDTGERRAASAAFRLAVPAQSDGTLSVTEARCQSVYASPVTGGIEFRAAAELRALWERESRVTQAVAVSACPEEPIDLSGAPSIVLVPRGGETLWELAKRWHSDIDAIEQANRGWEEKNNILIPRCR